MLVLNLARAIRSLRRTPVFALAVVGSLVLGITAVATMFTIVQRVLWADLPYQAPERLMAVGFRGLEYTQIEMSPAIFLGYQARAKKIDAIGIYRSGYANVRDADLTGLGDAPAENVSASWISASLIPTLGLSPLLGRHFNADEERRGGPNAVILSEAEWRSRFHAAKDIIGQSLVVNDAAREIVGVMPAQFAFPHAGTRLWLPVKTGDDLSMGDFSYAGIARIGRKHSIEEVQGELAALLPRVAEMFPRLQAGGSTAEWLSESRLSPLLRPLREELTVHLANTLRLLLAAAGLVLLISLSNVSNLLLVRVDARRQAMLVRRALGASRWQAMGLELGECLCLVAVSGVLAATASYIVVSALGELIPHDIPRLAEIRFGTVGFGAVIVLCVLSALLCAAVALMQAPSDRARSLHAGALRHASSKPRARFRVAMSLLQISLSFMVTLCAAMLLRSAQLLQAVNPGFNSQAVSTLRILLPFARYDAADMVAFHARLLDQVRALPGVDGAGLTLKLPLDGSETLTQGFNFEGGSQVQSLPVNVISDGYFGALEIPLLAGRDFTPLAHSQALDVILNQRAALTLFADSSGQTVIGKKLALAPIGPSYRVVGVVADVRDEELTRAPRPLLYRPQTVPVDALAEPGPRASMALVVRTRGSDAALIPAIRAILRSLDPGVPMFDVKTLQEVTKASHAREDLLLQVVSASALVALLLSAIGLYGLMTSLLTQRRFEFGVRLALGASGRSIATLLLSRAAVLIACGLLMGLLMYLPAASVLSSFLFVVRASDLVVIMCASLSVFVISLLACSRPIMMAARVEPAHILRAF